MEEALVFGKEWLSVFAPGHQAVIAAHPDGHHGSKNMQDVYKRQPVNDVIKNNLNKKS